MSGQWSSMIQQVSKTPHVLGSGTTSMHDNYDNPSCIFSNPLTVVIVTINPSEIEIIFANLASVNGAPPGSNVGLDLRGSPADTFLKRQLEA